MADFEAIGKALQIPQSVLNNIEKIDQKINLIASDSEKMATHFMSAMTRMGTGADGLLKKLQAIQGVINGLGSVNTGGLGNVGKGMENTATQAEKAAASISEAADALNKFNQTWKGSGQVTKRLDSLATREQVNLLRELNNQAMQTSRTLTQMNRENSLEARKKANETKIASQEETNATNRKMEALKRENAQTKINTAEYRNYVSALTMSEISENSRLKKIERMNTVLSELQRKEALYSNEIEITRKKIEQLTRENESLARVRDKANKQRTDERTNTQALNAYNRAMAASEALVTQRINKIAKLRQAEEMLRSASGNYATQLNRISQEIARLNRLNERQVDSYGRVIRSQRNLVNTSQQLTRQLALLFSVSQIEGYIQKLVQVRGEFELQNTALASILGNQDQANVLFQQITDLAVRSPFTVKELTTYTKSLSAYSVEYEKLYDTTKMLADVSSGLGVDMQRLILAFGQVKAANFLRGCLGYNTPVMLYDGSIKKVQDVVVGDVLINEKGEPVNVLELIRGRETMFLVEQVSGNNRISYRVNRNHILTLWNVQEQRLEDVYVYDYLKNKDAYLGLKIVDGEKVYYDIEVTKDRIDDYYGFVLDGNKRFRLGDGTITHNTETRQFTEAGINMLGELAKYYTELEGRIVSVSEVQDRQFRRMISFQDVEQVFKRLTSEGGMFYNMQERQAETLAGQMSNLRDQIDIMLNDIGTANEGVLKGTVSIIKTVVENWEIFSQAIHAAAAGFVTYTTTTLIAAGANGKFAASALAATASSKGLTAAMAKVILAFKSLGTFIKTNPITLIVSALTGAIVWWQQHQRAIEENKKSYDPLVNSITRAKDELNSLTKEIETQNGKIRDAVSDIDNYSKGTEEYARAEAEANAEREKQDALLEQLKTKYPEIYAGIVKQKDGTVELTNALKEQNNYLGDAQYLAYLLRDTVGGSDDGFDKQVERASEAMKNLRNDTAEADNAFRAMYSKIQEYFAVNEYASEDLKKSIDEIATGGGNSMEKIYKIFSMAVKEHGENIGDLRDIVWEYKENADNVRDSTKEWNKESKELAKIISEVAKTYIQDIDVSTEEGRKRAENALKTLLQMLGIQEKAVRDFVEQTFEVEIGVKINLEPTPKSLGGFEKQINDYLDEHQFTLIGRIQPGGDADKFFDNLSANLSDYKKELEHVTQATEQLYASEGKTNEQRAKELRTIISQIETTQKAFGRFNETSKGGGRSSSKDPMLDRFKEMIKLIEEAKKRYDELNEEFSSEVATQMVRTQFADTPAGDIIATMAFDAQGVVNGLNKAIQATGKAAQEEYRKAFQDASRPFETKLLLEPKIEKREQLEQQIEDMFDQYNLSIELTSTGISGDAIKSLFGTNIIDLETLKDEILKLKPVFEAAGLNWHEVWEKTEERLTEESNKQLQERLKSYAKYLKQTVSERARIEIEAQKKIADIQGIDTLSDTQKQGAISNIREEADKEKAKVIWEDFQNTDLYISMFNDLENVSSKTLEYMRQKLIEIRDTTKNLPVEDLKAINEQLNKMQEVSISRNPFQGIADNIREVVKARKEWNEVEDEYLAKNEEKDFLESSIAQQEVLLSKARARYDAEVKTNGAVSAQAMSQKMTINMQEKALSKDRERLKVIEEILKKLGLIRDNLQWSEMSLGQRFSQIGQWAGELSSAVPEIASSFENIFGNMSDKGADIVNTFSEVLGGVSNMATGVGRFMSGDVIGGSIQALTGLVGTIGSLVQIGDKKKERQIQRELELVENLEKAYEKLEEAIDNAYSIDTLGKATEGAASNIKDQIDSYEEMIRLEQDKKKTDKDRIKEWEEQIEQLEEQLDEIYTESFNKVTGDILSDVLSAAENFTDAWLNAFLETGDGMQGLEDSFDDMITNMLKRQASMLITQQWIEQWKKQLEQYINPEKGDLELTTDEAKKWVNSVTSSLPQLNEALEAYFKAMEEAGVDLSGSNNGDNMSGLQRGIQSITEQTAEVLAALLESVRFFVSDENAVIHNIYNWLTTMPAETPLMQELRLQTQHLASMDSLLTSVIKSSSGKGKVMRVEIV